MPRRDGFPTNREIQVDFTSQARDVFVAAAERAIEAKVDLHPAYQDKPLDHLQLSLSRRYNISDESPQAVESERLEISPLLVSTADELKYEPYEWGHAGNELFRDASDDVLEHYKSLARIIGETVIDNSLRFSQLSPNAVEASWTAWKNDGSQSCRHVDSFKERPSKQSLVAAKYFAEEAARYVQSDEFEKDASTRYSDMLYGYRDTSPKYDMQHVFSFRITPNLPINGHESREFIEYYAEEMSSRHETALHRLDRKQQLGAPKLIIQYEQDIVAKYKAALDRALKYLA